MRDDMRGLRDDIDSIEGQAQAGPGLAGLFIFVTGLIYGLAALGVWLELTALVHLPAAISGEEFMIGLGGQIVFMLVLGHARRNHVGPSRNGRLFRAVWTGLGLSIMVAALGVGVSAARLHNAAPWMAFGTVVMALYGGGWLVYGWLARRLWMLAVAAGAGVSVIALGLTAGRSDQMLIYASCLLLFAALPGLVLIIGDKRARP